MCIEGVWISIERFVWWQEEQREVKEEEESDEEIEGMSQIQRKMIVLLNQLLEDDEYKSGLISGLAF